MKKIMTALIALLGLIFSAAAASPLGFTKVKVETELFAAPATLFKGGGVSYSVPTKNLAVNKWLMIKIEFTPVLEKNSFTTVTPIGGEQRVATRGWFDNVELTVRVLFDTGMSHQKKTVYGLFSGKCLFWSIRQDGQKHTALMFVPAQLIDRYSIGSIQNSNARVAAKNHFFVEAQFSCDGTVLGKGFCNLPAAKLAQQQFQFDQLVKNVPPQLRIEHSVLPKNQTPWAEYYPDAFPLEKEIQSKK